MAQVNLVWFKVVLRLASRDLWAANFERRMRQAIVDAPTTLVSP